MFDKYYVDNNVNTHINPTKYEMKNDKTSVPPAASVKLVLK